eukprot:2282645-Rhodomonas_salina.1
MACGFYHYGPPGNRAFAGPPGFRALIRASDNPRPVSNSISSKSWTTLAPCGRRCGCGFNQDPNFVLRISPCSNPGLVQVQIQDLNTVHLQVWPTSRPISPCPSAALWYFSPAMSGPIMKQTTPKSY